MGRPSVQCDNFEIYCSPWAKSICLYKYRFTCFKKSNGEPYGEFSEPGFPQNFAKNDRHDLKLGCIDASRRQLQFVLKIGV
jgi:hypothetical protein